MIQVDQIVKSFDGTQILKGISTVFEKGKTNLIIGQSGSGKTVFLKCLLGLFQTDSGKIFFENKAIHEKVLSIKSLKSSVDIESFNIFLGLYPILLFFETSP